MKYARPDINAFLGLNNRLDPCSYEYREGYAYVSDASRIDEAGRWAEQPTLGSCSSPPDQLVCPVVLTGESSVSAVTITNETNSKIQKTSAFATYVFRTGDLIEVISGTNATAGIYTITSRTSANEVIISGNAVSGACTNAVITFGHPAFHCKNIAVEGTNKIITGIDSSTPIDVGPNTFLYASDGTDLWYGKADGTRAKVAQITAPTLSAAAGDGSGATILLEEGTYHYIVTTYDSTRKRESLPSAVKAVTVDSALHDSVELTMTGMSTKYLIYRTRVTNAANARYNPTNIFYYVGDTTSGTFNDYLPDTDVGGYEYEGRGTKPPASIDYLIRFNNRMLYFVGNDLYWSSAGRPEEVAQEYSLALPDGTITCKPLLSIGIYGEAKFEITELAGQTVTGGFLRGGKCWIATAGMLGYLEATSKLEGYRFHIVRKGIGLVNDKCIADTPYGIFGADRLGMWLLTNNGVLKRISDGVVDITDGTGKSTALAQSDITNSFLTYLPTLKETLWGITRAGSDLITNGDFASGDTGWTKGTGWSIYQNQYGLWSAGGAPSSGDFSQVISITAGHTYQVYYTLSSNTSTDIIAKVGGTSGMTRSTNGTFYEEIVAGSTSTFTITAGSTSPSGTCRIDDIVVIDQTDCVQIVYQANRGLFCGPYSHIIMGGCDFVSAGGAQAFLDVFTRALVGKDALPNSSPATAQEFQIWMGQSSLETVKDDLSVEVLYSSVTADKNVTVTVYQNNIASTTGATTSNAFTHNDDNLVGLVKTQGSGRMLMVKIAIPSDCTAPVLDVLYSANFIPWKEKSGR